VILFTGVQFNGGTFAPGFVIHGYQQSADP
jgi:hypothetical protein